MAAAEPTDAKLHGESGITWKPVEAVLNEEEAEQLLKETSEELLAAGFDDKVMKAMSHGQTVVNNKQCLYILGPSAAGKSSSAKRNMEKNTILNEPEGALTVDGEFVRSASESWKKAVGIAERHGVFFSNYFDKYFKAPGAKVKANIEARAIKDGSNLIWTDSGSHLTKTLGHIERLLAAGYNIQFIAVVADKEVCAERGKGREVEDGKKYSNKNWENSIQNIMEVEAHLIHKGVHESTGGVKVYYNKVSLQEIAIRRLDELLKTGTVRDVEDAGGGWCEIQLLAGIYEGEGKRLQCTPTCLTEEVVDVMLTASGHTQPCKLQFDVSQCMMGTHELSLGPDGRAVLTSPEGTMVQISPIPGMSLNPGLSSMECLKGSSFIGPKGSSFRSLTDEELKCALEAAGLSGPSAAPSRESPRALVVMAPSGGGKTTVLKSFAKQFDMNPSEAVKIDSAIFRDCHAQYMAIIENGKRNGGIWWSAWPAVKSVFSQLKKSFHSKALKAKQDILISDTGAELSKTVKQIGELKEAGYKVHLLGIFCDPGEIMARGIARELHEGKRYNRDLKKLCKTFEAFPPTVKAINGDYVLVMNAQGKSPELHRQGKGGESITFDLHSALAGFDGSHSHSDVDDLEIAGLASADLKYIMEGNLNIVCAYEGSDPGWEGKVLRCRKGDNSTYRVDGQFAKNVAVKMLGTEYVDPGEMIALEAATIQEIDDAILSKRPKKRQHQHLDAVVRDRTGKILAMKVQNLMSAPIPAKVVTVELKPKCGLKERQGLPSRYTLLQYHKLNMGKINSISGYDPVKLFSKNPQLIHETMMDSMMEPQNNIRIFIDGSPVFSEEVLKKNKEGTDAVYKELDAKLRDAGIAGKDCLLSLMSGVLSSPTMMAVPRLKRLQAWAAGETAPLAEQLYQALRERFGDSTAEICSRVENFEMAVEGIEECPCDESGIESAVQAMDKVLEKAHSSWNETVEKEVIIWLCRFLLGRTSHDVSVLFNFIHIPAEELTLALDAKLRRARYRPLDFFGLAGGLAWTGLWFRTSVVDTDAKSADKIPEYATQLDEYSQAYYKRYEIQIPEKEKEKNHQAVGGHAEDICFDGDTIWKKSQMGGKGQTEFDFLRHCLDIPSAKGVVPTLAGFRVHSGEAWLGMSNLLDGLKHPCILDVKIGTRTWNTSATDVKSASQQRKAQSSTTGTLGLRVVGCKIKEEKFGHKYGKDIVDEAGLKALFDNFLCTPSLRETALSTLKQVELFWRERQDYAFYASSLLFAYDDEARDECRVALIDFANVERISSKAEDASGFDVGMASLFRVLSAA